MKMKKSFINILFIVVYSLVLTSNAQESAKYFAGCNLEAGTESHVHYTPPPFNLMSKNKTSVFELTFINATSEQEAAVRHSAEIWSSILVSDVPIKVLVTFYPMPDFLGQCVSNLVKNFPDTPMEDTWYVSSLADAVTGVDQQPDEYDMDIFLTSAAQWYYGLDGNCPSNKFDLVDVALHEMGHGLGYFGLGFTNDGVGSYGYISQDILTRPIAFTFPDLEGLPTSYDQHIMNSNNEFFTDTTLFSNPSEELRNLFVGNDLFFKGEFSTEANGDKPVKLFAPSTFYFASSILHLDENTYPAGNINTLMTPYVDYGEANHNPGPVTFGLLKDLGWTLNDSITVSVSEDNVVPNTFTLSQNYPNPFNPTTTINFTLPSPLKGEGPGVRSVKLNIFNSLGQHIITLFNEQKSPGSYEVKFDAGNLPSGIYLYTLTIGGEFAQSKKMILMK